MNLSVPEADQGHLQSWPDCLAVDDGHSEPPRVLRPTAVAMMATTTTTAARASHTLRDGLMDCRFSGMWPVMCLALPFLVRENLAERLWSASLIACSWRTSPLPVHLRSGGTLATSTSTGPATTGRPTDTEFDPRQCRLVSSRVRELGASEARFATAPPPALINPQHSR